MNLYYSQSIIYKYLTWLQTCPFTLILQRILMKKNFTSPFKYTRHFYSTFFLNSISTLQCNWMLDLLFERYLHSRRLRVAWKICTAKQQRSEEWIECRVNFFFNQKSNLKVLHNICRGPCTLDDLPAVHCEVYTTVHHHELCKRRKNEILNTQEILKKETQCRQKNPRTI